MFSLRKYIKIVLQSKKNYNIVYTHVALPWRQKMKKLFTISKNADIQVVISVQHCVRKTTLVVSLRKTTFFLYLGVFMFSEETFEFFYKNLQWNANV